MKLSNTKLEYNENGAYVQVQKLKSCDINFATAPSRSNWDREGTYTNDSINTIEIKFERGYNTLLDSVSLKKDVPLKWNNGAYAYIGEFTVNNKINTKIDGETITSMSFIPNLNKEIKIVARGGEGGHVDDVEVNGSSVVHDGVAEIFTNHLAEKTYVDAELDKKLSLAGGTMKTYAQLSMHSGRIVDLAEPTGPTHAATKKYVDEHTSEPNAYLKSANQGGNTLNLVNKDNSVTTYTPDFTDTFYTKPEVDSKLTDKANVTYVNNTFASKMDLASETNRATAKENTLQTAITNLDAKKADKTALDQEISHRATAVSELQTAVANRVKYTDIIDDVTSIATDKVAPLKTIKDLNDRINALSAGGRYLSGWNCSTGLPDTQPGSLPYTYKSGDYYLVTAISGTTNFRPDGTIYTGAPSTVSEVGTPALNDYYRFDGMKWTLSKGAASIIEFINISGDAMSNPSLSTYFNLKANKSSLQAETTTRENADTALSNRINANQIAIDQKLDKVNGSGTGTHNLENLIVSGDLESDQLQVNDVVVVNSIDVPTPQSDNQATTKKYVDDLVATKSTVSVSETGTSTEKVKYITIDGVEKKVGGDYVELLGNEAVSQQPYNIPYHIADLKFDTTDSKLKANLMTITLDNNKTLKTFPLEVEIPTGEQVQSDWAQEDETKADFIKNKPTNLVTTIDDQEISGRKEFRYEPTSRYGLLVDDEGVKVTKYDGPLAEYFLHLTPTGIARLNTVGQTTAWHLPEENGTFALAHQIPDVTQFLHLTGGTMVGDLNMGGKFVHNIATPTDDSDATTKSYVDNLVSTIGTYKSTYSGSESTTLNANTNYTLGSLTLPKGVWILTGNSRLYWSSSSTDSGLKRIWFHTNTSDTWYWKEWVSQANDNDSFLNVSGIVSLSSETTYYLIGNCTSQFKNANSNFRAIRIK